MATFATFASAAARGLGLRTQVTPASLRTAATTTRSYASSGESSLQTPPNHHTHFRRSKAEASSKRVLRADFKPAIPPSPLSLCLSLVVFGKPDSISLFLFSILTTLRLVPLPPPCRRKERNLRGRHDPSRLHVAQGSRPRLRRGHVVSTSRPKTRPPRSLHTPQHVFGLFQGPST